MRTFFNALVGGAAIAVTSWHPVAARQAVAADLIAVKALYVAADYEGALRLLASADPDEDVVKVEEYRALCLLALGRTADAERSVEQILARRPLYEVDSNSVSPRMVSLVSAVRQRLLPVLARNLYGLARRNIEHREYAAAVSQLTEMLAIVEAAGPEAGLEDLRSLGTGFLELSRKQLAVVTPPATSTGASVTAPATDGPQLPPTRQSAGLPTAVYAEFLKLVEGQTAAARTPPPVSASADSSAPVLVRPDIYSDVDRIQPPVPVQREVPRWQPPDEAARNGTHRGKIQLVISEDGVVESATVTESVHEAYDASLLEAARKWRYRPATRNGQAVRYRLETEVVLRPPTP